MLGFCLQDAAPGIPILVFLSPGLDVAASVEAMGRAQGFTADTGRYISWPSGIPPESMLLLHTMLHKNSA